MDAVTDRVIGLEMRLDALERMMQGLTRVVENLAKAQTDLLAITRHLTEVE